jgi:glycosyltransferase involved in cell wall biosynthesis
VLPSETESFGLAALEAMACQVPVISTNTGGQPEVMENGFCGFMSNVGDIEDMAANGIKILESDSSLQRFKANALEHAKKFDIMKVLPVYEALYKKVIAESIQKN